MNKIRKTLAVLAVTASIIAIIVAIVGGTLLLAIESFVTLLNPSGTIGYPLGPWVLVLYAIGIVLSVAACRWPLAAGITMLPLGAITFLFGGPVAQIYGLLIAGFGIVFAATRGKTVE